MSAHHTRDASTQCDDAGCSATLRCKGNCHPALHWGQTFRFSLGPPSMPRILAWPINIVCRLIRVCSLHSWEQWTDELQPLKELSLRLHGGPHLEAEYKKSNFRKGNQNNLPRNIQTLTLFIRCILPSHVLHKEFSIKSTPIPRLYDCFATFLGGSTWRLGGSGRLFHIEINFLGS